MARAAALVDPYLTVPHAKLLKPTSAALILQLCIAAEEGLLAQYPDSKDWENRGKVEQRVHAMKDEVARLEALAKAPEAEVMA